MNNTLPKEIESLCVEKLNGQNVPLWPYVAAVTGHRSFASPGEVDGLPGYKTETITTAFHHELEQMARQWKKACGSVNAPFILLTGMAEGADQLAAEVALELPDDLNVKVAAILPMEQDLFRLTITEENRKRFDSLMERSHLTFSLPMLVDSPEYRAQLADVDNPATEPLRRKQYDMLGKFLALHSHVLFAFWDGIDMKELLGGTSTTLHFKLEGNTEHQTQSDILTFTSVGPVVQFLLPRNNPDNLKEPVAKLNNPEEIAVFYWSKRDLWDKEEKRYFFPSRKQMTEENRCKTSVSLKPEILGALSRIGDLNTQSTKFSNELQNQLPGSRKYLFESQSNADDFCDAETEILINHYTYSDKLAEHFKNGMQGIVFYYLVGVVLFFISSALLSSFWEIRQNRWGETTCFSFVNNGHDTWCDMFFSMPCSSILYWISIFLFTSVFLLAKYLKNHVRFYRFRAVAEALRVQIFWRIAGMSACVSGFYRTHQLPETDWLRTAINGLDVLLAAPENQNFKKTPEERLTFVRDVWVNGQLKFFQSRIIKGAKAYTHSSSEIFWFSLWFVLIVIFPFIPTWMEFFHVQYALTAEIVQVIYGLFLASIPIYGFMLFWKTIKQPQSELNRYKQMLFPYDRAILLLESKPEIKEQQTILRQLGTEAISENASWLLSMGERELALPR